MADEQCFPCKEAGCGGTVAYRREVVKAYRGNRPEPEAPKGRIIRVYLKCEPNRHLHEYAVKVVSVDA